MNNIGTAPSNDFEKMLIGQECAEGIIRRLSFMKFVPNAIDIAGSARAKLEALVGERYPNSEVMNEDKLVAPPDMIIANLYIPWQQDINHTFKLWKNKLVPDGLLMLTALGPDTCKECPESMRTAILPALIDMHEIGDALLHAGFSDPVLDVTEVTLTYESMTQLITELKAWEILAPNCNADTTAWTEVTFEIVHAHAWQSNAYRAQAGEVNIPVAALKNKIKSF